ncbi:MAG: hypothetical protein KME33_33490 [Aetokthonos hydrillicola CCALA 1050]|jgi:hypothetical protein|nr:hypothetical protein [Aetokthonos hydrillicola CCALA 1050]
MGYGVWGMGHGALGIGDLTLFNFSSAPPASPAPYSLCELSLKLFSEIKHTVLESRYVTKTATSLERLAVSLSH